MPEPIQMRQASAATINDDDDDEFDNISPDISHIEIEDDTPVDSIPSEKNQRALTEPPYASWDGGGRSFLICANVGIFYAPNEQPIVPDVFLSMDVQANPDWQDKRNRTYFIWEFGKPPEVAIEIVSNRKGGEAGNKMHIYSRVGVDHYVIYDPLQILGNEKLRVYERRFQRYFSAPEPWFEGVGLGLRLWDGVFEGIEETWLRWCYRDGTVVPSGAERAVLAQEQAILAQEQTMLAQQQASEAQQVAAQEMTRRHAAEEEIVRLKAELDQLRTGSPQAKKGRKR